MRDETGFFEHERQNAERMYELEARIAELEARIEKLEHPYRCEKCGVDYSSSDALAQHQRSWKHNRE